MEKGREIAKVVGVLPDHMCVVLKINKGKTLKHGALLHYEREGAGMGASGFHDSKHRANSIEIDHKKQGEVSREDGLCAIEIVCASIDDLPPAGCTVFLVEDTKAHREASPYMAKSGL